MRWIFILLVAVGALYWWQHREPTAVTSLTPPTSATVAATPSPASPEASWPKRNIDHAQSALDAVKKQREEL